MATAHRRRVLISGAGKNIGEQLAHSFAADGFDVLLIGRREKAVAKVAASIRDGGGRAWAAECDVTDRSAIEDLQTAFEIDGEFRVDVLVNNAMVRVQRPFLEMTQQEWSAVIDVTLTGAFNLTKLCLPRMQERSWGRIVNFSGLAGQAGAIGRAGIVTAKAGIIGFTKAIALEAAPYSVTVNAVSPGIIDTIREPAPGTSPETVELANRHYAKERQLIALGRMGTVDEVMAAVRYLTSDSAGFTTGQVLNINGGRYLG